MTPTRPFWVALCAAAGLIPSQMFVFGFGAPWQPPFTVALSVLDDTDDLGHLLRLLRDDPWGPRWAVVRPCQYHSCPCRSSISKLNDQLYQVARYEVAAEDFRRKFLSMPCHMLQNDSSCNQNLGKKRKFSSSQWCPHAIGHSVSHCGSSARSYV